MTSGPADKALEFTLLDIKTRSQIIADFHANGISLMVAVFGADDAPTSTRKDPVKLAKSIAKFVKDYDVSHYSVGDQLHRLRDSQLDGVDIDWEDFDSINAGTGRAESWIINFTKALRKLLPVGGASSETARRCDRYLRIKQNTF
jgi:chitinase